MATKVVSARVHNSAVDAPALVWRQVSGERDTGGPDSFDLWADVVTTLKAQLGLSSVGLLVHGYSGGIEDEAFTVGRKYAAPTTDLRFALGAMQEDELHVFRGR